MKALRPLVLTSRMLFNLICHVFLNYLCLYSIDDDDNKIKSKHTKLKPARKNAVVEPEEDDV